MAVDSVVRGDHVDQALTSAGQARAIALNGVEPREGAAPGHSPDPMPAIVATSATAIVHGLLAVTGAVDDLASDLRARGER